MNNLVWIGAYTATGIELERKFVSSIAELKLIEGKRSYWCKYKKKQKIIGRLDINHFFIRHLEPFMQLFEII